jgi:hypothetical protein
MGSAAVEPIRLSNYLADPHELETVVTELRSVARRAGMDRTLAIGSLVLHRFFGGSVQAWQERRKNKNNSVRRLAQHPLCPLSRSAINQAIGIFVTLQTLACGQTFSHIEASHVAAVLHLRPHSQREWLERAERERWGVRQLKEYVTQQRRQTGERRGRPRVSRKNHALSSARRFVRSLESIVAELSEGDLLLSDLHSIAELAERLGALERRLLGNVRLGPTGRVCANQPAVKEVG